MTRSEPAPAIGRRAGATATTEPDLGHEVALNDGSVRPDPGAAGGATTPPAGRDGLSELERALLSAVERRDVARTLIDYGRARAARCALFAVARDELRCLIGSGRGLEGDAVQRTRIPLGTDSVFDDALGRDAFYLGPVPPLPTNRDLYSLLGGLLPPMVLLVPIRIRGRTVAMFYMDNDREPIVSPDLPTLRRVAAKVGLAFEIVLLRRKLVEV